MKPNYKKWNRGVGCVVRMNSAITVQVWEVDSSASGSLERRQTTISPLLTMHASTQCYH